MTKLLLTILPLGLGSAVSPTLLTVTVALLSGKDRPRLKTFVYLAGSALTLAVIGGAALIGGGSTSSAQDGPSRLSALIDLTLGILLLALGVNKLVRPERPKQERTRPEKSVSLSRQLLKSGLIGVVMTITDFSSLVFYLAAAKQTVDARVGAVDAASIMSIMALFVMLPIWGPLAVSFAAPKASASFFDFTGKILKDYSRYIIAAICLFFGIYLVLKASRGLG